MRGWMRTTAVAVMLVMIGLAGAESGKVGAGTQAKVVKVAVVGDSITVGTGTKGDNGYPMQLGRMLGSGYEVKGFGVGGSTLMNSGNKPYQKTKEFAAAKDFGADVVVIMLGTNDSKPYNWKHKEDFEKDYKDMVGQFQALASKPKIYLVKPCWVSGNGAWGIADGPVVDEGPMIEGIAKDVKAAGVIDVHTPTKEHPEYFPDKVHPNNDGAAVIAKTIFEGLTGKAYTGASVIVEPPTATQAATQGAGMKKGSK